VLLLAIGKCGPYRRRDLCAAVSAPPNGPRGCHAPYKPSPFHQGQAYQAVRNDRTFVLLAFFHHTWDRPLGPVVPRRLYRSPCRRPGMPVSSRAPFNSHRNRLSHSETSEQRNGGSPSSTPTKSS